MAILSSILVCRDTGHECVLEAGKGGAHTVGIRTILPNTGTQRGAASAMRARAGAGRRAASLAVYTTLKWEAPVPAPISFGRKPSLVPGTISRVSIWSSPLVAWLGRRPSPEESSGGWRTPRCSGVPCFGPSLSDQEGCAVRSRPLVSPQRRWAFEELRISLRVDP